MRLTLVEVGCFPDHPEPLQLYWSKEYRMCGHLCACGCGDFIQLPVGPVDYTLTLGTSGPTLRPSVGNWDICDAHYLITDGEIQWAPKWTPEQIAAGRAMEDARRAAYYTKPKGLFGWIAEAWRSLMRILGIGR